MGLDKVLVLGATGYIGKHIAKASAGLGHPTFALVRPASATDSAKAEVVKSLQAAGVTVLHGDLEDHESLIDALKKVDVVISAVGIAQLGEGQLKLVEAIKQVGHIKRFLPSEFGTELTRAFYPGSLPILHSAIQHKLRIREAVKEAGIPHTFVVSNSFAGWYVANLGQSTVGAPPTDKAFVVGHAKAYHVEEDDIGVYTVKAAVDPRAENKVLYLRPAKNLLSHGELVELWETKSGHKLEKIQLEKDDVLKKIEDAQDLGTKIRFTLHYANFISGDQSNFDVPLDAVEATDLFPEIPYTTIDKYLERFL